MRIEPLGEAREQLVRRKVGERVDDEVGRAREVEADGKTVVVTKVGPSPLPHDKRLCAYVGR